jgi:hypothetical protein
MNTHVKSKISLPITGLGMIVIGFGLLFLWVIYHGLNVFEAARFVGSAGYYEPLAVRNVHWSNWETGFFLVCLVIGFLGICLSLLGVLIKLVASLITKIRRIDVSFL